MSRKPVGRPGDGDGIPAADDRRGTDRQGSTEGTADEAGAADARWLDDEVTEVTDEPAEPETSADAVADAEAEVAAEADDVAADDVAADVVADDDKADHN